MELGENPELPRLDVTNASTKRRCKTTIERKWFELQIQGTLQVTTANILVSEVEEAFSKICQIMKVDENRYQVLYPQRSEDGGVDFITLSKDAFLKDALMTFYLTCEEGSKLILTPISISKDHKRDYRPVEYGYNTIIKKGFTVDKRYYEYLQENPSVIEKFLAKRDYINLILGKECNNFLNPAHFRCPIQGCQKEVALGSFNNISRIVEHFRIHSRKGEPYAKSFMKRHNYMRQDVNWVKAINFKEDLKKLDEEVEPASTDNRVLIDPSGFGKFKGKHLMLDLPILRKILLREPGALSGLECVKERQKSFFSNAIERNRAESQQSRKRILASALSSPAPNNRVPLSSSSLPKSPLPKSSCTVTKPSSSRVDVLKTGRCVEKSFIENRHVQSETESSNGESDSDSDTSDSSDSTDSSSDENEKEEIIIPLKKKKSSQISSSSGED